MKAPGLEWVPFMLLASRAGFAANPQPAAVRLCRRHRWAAGLLSFAGGVSRAMATGAGAWRSSKSGIRRAYILWLCTGSLDWNHFDRCFLRILQGWLFFWFVWGFIWSPWDWVALLPSFAATPALSLKWIWRQSSLYWLYQRGCFFMGHRISPSNPYQRQTVSPPPFPKCWGCFGNKMCFLHE